MTRRATVRILSDRGMKTVEVEASVKATASALIDMGRRQAGISADEFKSGEVVP